jgi:hypothetical protein
MYKKNDKFFKKMIVTHISKSHSFAFNINEQYGNNFPFDLLRIRITERFF